MLSKIPLAWLHAVSIHLWTRVYVLPGGKMWQGVKEAPPTPVLKGRQTARPLL